MFVAALVDLKAVRTRQCRREQCEHARRSSLSQHNASTSGGTAIRASTRSSMPVDSPKVLSTITFRPKGMKLTLEPSVDDAAAFGRWVDAVSGIVDTASAAGELTDTPTTCRLAWNLCAGTVGAAHATATLAEDVDLIIRISDMVRSAPEQRADLTPRRARKVRNDTAAAEFGDCHCADGANRSQRPQSSPLRRQCRVRQCAHRHCRTPRR